MIYRMLFFITIVLLSSELNAKPAFVWSQVVSNDSLSIRAIVENMGSCPTAIVDGKSVVMNVRYPTEKKGNNQSFERVCEVIVSRKIKQVIVDDIAVPVLSKEIKKIAVIGDTGCRVSSFYQQDCKSLNKWPLKIILDNIYKHKVDLVIHVGDYLYREVKCIDSSKCGDVNGDNWYTWREDWFLPSQLLATKVPFLFVRGNHESCKRAYKGWFRYLESGKDLQRDEVCNNFVSSWKFDSGKLLFYIHDSSYGNDMEASEEQINTMRKNLLPLIQKNKDKKDAWVITHRPFWSYVKRGHMINYGSLPQQQAFGEVFSKSISHILSGHIHVAQVLIMNNSSNQVIVGNSGALLDSSSNQGILGKVKIGQFEAKSVKNLSEFGFAVIEIENNKIVFYDENDKESYSYKYS